MKPPLMPSVFPAGAWPAGAYVEGLDLVLGRFCAFGRPGSVDLHQFTPSERKTS